MNGISFIKYMGHTILQIDVSNGNISTMESIDVYRKAFVFLKKYRREEKILVLHNIGSANLTKEWAAYVLPNFNEVGYKVKKRAFVAVKEDQDVFINLLISKLSKEDDSRRFKNYTEAINWLVFGDDKIDKEELDELKKQENFPSIPEEEELEKFTFDFDDFN